MANNYILFSEEITDLTAKEKEWLLKVLKNMDDVCDDSPDDESAEACVKWILGELDEASVDLDYWPDFSWQMENSSLWIYSEEGGNLNNVATLAQAFLKRFRPNRYWSFEYAYTCSKPRIGEFGGGGAFITAKEIKWLEPWQRIAEEETITDAAALLGQRVEDSE